MKLPARTFALILWALAVALPVEQWFAYLQQVQDFRALPPVGHDTVYLIFHLETALAYFAVIAGLGAVVWLLGDIRDRR